MKTKLRFYEDSSPYILVSVEYISGWVENKFARYSLDKYFFNPPDQAVMRKSVGAWTHVCKYINTRKL